MRACAQEHREIERRLGAAAAPLERRRRWLDARDPAADVQAFVRLYRAHIKAEEAVLSRPLTERWLTQQATQRDRAHAMARPRGRGRIRGDV
jgi:hypothetical protein